MAAGVPQCRRPRSTGWQPIGAVGPSWPLQTKPGSLLTDAIPIRTWANLNRIAHRHKDSRETAEDPRLPISQAGDGQYLWLAGR